MVLAVKESRDANPFLEQRSFVPELNVLVGTSLHVSESGEGGGEACCFSARLSICLKSKSSEEHFGVY